MSSAPRAAGIGRAAGLAALLCAALPLHAVERIDGPTETLADELASDA